MNIARLNEIKVVGKPEGWVVKVDRDGDRIKSANFGVYVTEEAFVSVPIHFVCIDKLVKINGFDIDGTTFYGIPVDLNLRLIKTKVKNSGKQIPMLVPCKDGQSPSQLACVTFLAKGMESIIDITTQNVVVREFIPPNRKITALILTKEDIDISELRTIITTGIIGSYDTIENVITVDGVASTETKEPIKQEVKVATKFINFKTKFIKPTPKVNFHANTVTAPKTV